MRPRGPKILATLPTTGCSTEHGLSEQVWHACTNTTYHHIWCRYTLVEINFTILNLRHQILCTDKCCPCSLCSLSIFTPCEYSYPHKFSRATWHHDCPPEILLWSARIEAKMDGNFYAL
jgi:hypothetical protein